MGQTQQTPQETDREMISKPSSEISTLKSLVSTLTSKLQEKSHEITSLHEKIATLSDADLIVKENEKLAKENRNLKDRNAYVEKELQNAKKTADGAINERDSLKTEVDRLNKERDILRSQLESSAGENAEKRRRAVFRTAIVILSAVFFLWRYRERRWNEKYDYSYRQWGIWAQIATEQKKRISTLEMELARTSPDSSKKKISPKAKDRRK